ncbi:hypothetical protein H8790_07340 [Oscillibacter hominis]|uniref:Uncharacterized protein n=1 Tax=Oscillibacter hominis TaxID=2763056 RepID=A0A7G9B187_9FIRM|nr:hypothetical protein [Oscillibacter hominis]QNL43318.1 hypothetical protein H8790_07340 [Oscillibacter hominis]
MKEALLRKLANLLSIKSLVTLALTAVFCVLALRGGVNQDFMTIFTVVIAFYFGTQARKEGSGNGDRQ